MDIFNFKSCLIENTVLSENVLFAINRNVIAVHNCSVSFTVAIIETHIACHVRCIETISSSSPWIRFTFFRRKFLNELLHIFYGSSLEKKGQIYHIMISTISFVL